MKKPRTLHQQIPELRDALAKPRSERAGKRSVGMNQPRYCGGGNAHRWTSLDVKKYITDNTEMAEEQRVLELRNKLSHPSGND